MKTSRPPRSGVPNGSIFPPAPSTTASSGSGTARDPGSTAAATCSVTPMPHARRKTAARCVLPATTPAPNPPPLPIIPTDFEMPPGGLNLRWPDDRYEQDLRLQDYKGFAAIAFARANKVNRITMDSPNARFGIMASGKSYEDIRQALRELGITPEVAAKIGLLLYKIGMPWPLEPEGVRQFAVGLEEIFIIEERREIVENQVKQELFNWRDDVRPRIVGKMDDHHKRFLTFAAELSVASLASSLTERLLRLNLNPEIAAMLRAKADWFNARHATQMQAVPPATPSPFSS